MQQNERLTSERKNGIKTGYWVGSKVKKDDVVQRLGQYEDTGLSPEEIRAMKTAEVPDQEKFDAFLEELKDALEEYKNTCVNPPGYTSKLCFIAEVLTITADNPIKELKFTAGEIKKALELAKLK